MLPSRSFEFLSDASVQMIQKYGDRDWRASLTPSLMASAHAIIGCRTKRKPKGPDGLAIKSGQKRIADS